MGIKKVKKKKIKYSSILFKVTSKQKKVIDEYCKNNGLGTVQLFKLALRDFIERNSGFESRPPDNMVSENQLSIFDVINEIEQEDE